MPPAMNATPASGYPDIDPEEMMRGSPFAIPPTPQRMGDVMADALAPGELRRFLLAISCIVTVLGGFALMVLQGG